MGKVYALDDNSGSLGGVQIQDKLIIIGHGSPTKMADLDGFYLPNMLCNCGLRKVGVITFKACNIGSGNFLTECAKNLELMRIDFGWAKGYTGYSATANRSDTGKPKEKIEKKIINAVEKKVEKGGVEKTKIDADKTKIQVVLIKGNVWEFVPEPKTVKLKRLKVLNYGGAFLGMCFSKSPDKDKPVAMTKIPPKDLTETATAGDAESLIELSADDDDTFVVPLDED